MGLPDEYYDKKFRSIRNVFLNSLPYVVGEVSSDGSRERQTNRPDSDLDIIFSIVGDPSRGYCIPKITRILRDQFPNAIVKHGTNYVISMDFDNGGSFDIVLVSSAQLRHQRRNLRGWRGKHL